MSQIMKHTLQIRDIHNNTQFIIRVVPQGSLSFFGIFLTLKQPIYVGFFLKMISDQKENCIVSFVYEEDLEKLEKILTSKALLLDTPHFKLKQKIQGLDDYYVLLGLPESFNQISTFEKENLVNIKIHDGTFPMWKDEWCQHRLLSSKDFPDFKMVNDKLRDPSVLMTKLRYDFDTISAYVLHNDKFVLPATTSCIWVDRRLTTAYDPTKLAIMQEKLFRFINKLYEELGVVAYSIHGQHGVIVFVYHKLYGIFTPFLFSKFLSTLSPMKQSKLADMFKEANFKFDFKEWYKVYTSFDREAFENGRWNIPLKSKNTSNPISIQKVINTAFNEYETVPNTRISATAPSSSFVSFSLTTYNLLRDGFESHSPSKLGQVKRWYERKIHIRNALYRANSDIFCLQEIDDKNGMLSSLHLDNMFSKQYKSVITRFGESHGKPCQSAIVYNAEMFQVVPPAYEFAKKMRFIVSTFLHRESETKFCIVSVDCKNGQNESKEAARVKEFETLFRHISGEDYKDIDVYLICGSFNSDSQLASRTHGNYTFKNEVHSKLESNKFENISGNNITYNGWNPCTFDYVYLKDSKALCNSMVSITKVKHSIESKNAETPLPNLEKEQGSDHIPVTLKLIFAKESKSFGSVPVAS